MLLPSERNERKTPENQRYVFIFFLFSSKHVIVMADAFYSNISR